MTHRILIVEDEALIGWSMANALGKAGYDPVVVVSGEDAMEKVRGGGIELVISDYNLPRMSGLDLAVGVKEISGSLPVVILSADEELESTGTPSAGAIDYFIEKPFNLTDLVTLVDDILGRSLSNLINSRYPRK